MRIPERGFTFIELAIGSAIAAVVSAASVLVLFQILRSNETNNDYVTSVRQAENAGYWISHDIKMAQSVTTDNLTSPDFLALAWTEWNDSGVPTYHNVLYFFEGLTDGIGTLKRSHTSSGGISEQTLIARQIYYNSANMSYTSRASSQGQVLTLKLTSLSDERLESREYQIIRRINY